MRMVLAALLILSAVAPARADETLRWKLRKGQTLRYRSTSHVNQADEKRPGQIEANEMDFIEDLTLRVKDVDSAGVVDVEVTVDRFRSKTNLRGVKAEYDSREGKGEKAAPDAPRELGVPIHVFMDPRGEIREIRWPKEALERIKNDPVPPQSQGTDRDRINASSILRSNSVVLPEREVKPGESWIFTIQQKYPGNANIRSVDYISTYRYEETRDGLARIAIDRKRIPNGFQEPVTTQCVGLIRFDPVAGILRDVETRDQTVVALPRANGFVRTSSTITHNRSELVEGNDDEKKP